MYCTHIFAPFFSLQAKRLFDEAALDVEKQLVKVSRSGLTYFAEYKYGRLEHKMDHLACFAGKVIIGCVVTIGYCDLLVFVTV